jgi:aspartyl-tRNA(Asn)/glutamyl-tRNA(Gln) amidotransferase subunit B
VFLESFATGKQPSDVVRESGKTQISDESEIRQICRAAIDENPEVLDKYRGGQVSVMGFFVGQAMKKSGGRAKPELVQAIVKELLDAS